MSVPLKERAINLFTYFSELTNLRLKHVRHLDDFEEVLPLCEVPDEKECYTIISHFEGGDQPRDNVIIEVKKPKRVKPPTPSDDLKPWLGRKALTDSGGEPPTPSASIVDPVQPVGKSELSIQAEPVKYLNWSEQPELQKQYENFIESDWLPWATEDRRVSGASI